MVIDSAAFGLVVATLENGAPISMSKFDKTYCLVNSTSLPFPSRSSLYATRRMKELTRSVHRKRPHRRLFDRPRFARWRFGRCGGYQYRIRCYGGAPIAGKLILPLTSAADWASQRRAELTFLRSVQPYVCERGFATECGKAF
jgi:hypothetical protein